MRNAAWFLGCVVGSLLVVGTAEPGKDPSSHRAPPISVGNGCTYSTIGAAVSAVAPGSTIRLEGGRTFNESVAIAKDISIRGGYSGCASGSTSPTTVDPGGAGKAFDISGDVDVTLSNLIITGANDPMSDGGGIAFDSGTLSLADTTVMNCAARRGGGIWMGPGALLDASGVHVNSNSASIAGGGIRLYGATAVFSGDNEIDDNDAPMGGGIAGAATGVFNPHLTLSFVTMITNNDALSGSGLGGGISMVDGTVRLNGGVVMTGNTAEYGGAIYLERSSLDADGPMVDIGFNSANTNGGGIHATESDVSLAGGVVVRSNSAFGLTADGFGGGIFLQQSDLQASVTLISSNTAVAGGGIVSVGGSSVTLGAAPVGGDYSQGVMITGNMVSGDGGGMYLTSGSTSRIERTMFGGNQAGGVGGALVARDSTTEISNSLIVENASGFGPRAAVSLGNAASMLGRGLTLAYNAAGGAATGAAIVLSEDSPIPPLLHLRNSIVWGHAVSIGGVATVTCSDIEGGWSGDGNMDVDPLFVDAASSDYELDPASPVVDRCASFDGGDEDYWGNIRPWALVRPATPFDMGALEAESAPALVFFDSFDDGTLDLWSN